jgi:release factor glutamine methyltransferase
LITIEHALNVARQQLATEEAVIDSSVLLCHVLKCNQTYLLTWSDKLLTEQQQLQFEMMIEQRKTGTPVAYITGQRGFWSIDLNVTEATLIPRPDTELLVELVLSKLQPADHIVDLGTGSGAIALAIASELPKALVTACDFSGEALAVAKQNADLNDIDNVEFLQNDWLSGFASKSIDVIVSNPPYIESNDPHLQQGDLRFEPISALASGEDGLDDIRTIVKQATECLKGEGWLLIEHGYHQSQQVQALFLQHGFINVTAHKDFGGNDRVVMGQLAL